MYKQHSQSTSTTGIEILNIGIDPKNETKKNEEKNKYDLNSRITSPKRGVFLFFD